MLCPKSTTLPGWACIVFPTAATIAVEGSLSRWGGIVAGTGQIEGDDRMPIFFEHGFNELPGILTGECAVYEYNG